MSNYFLRKMRCAAPNCGAKSSKGSTLRLYGTPKKRELFEKWAKFLGVPQDSTQKFYVCGRHFERKCFSFVGSTCIRLLPRAYPTLHVPKVLLGQKKTPGNIQLSKNKELKSKEAQNELPIEERKKKEFTTSKNGDKVDSLLNGHKVDTLKLDDLAEEVSIIEGDEVVLPANCGEGDDSNEIMDDIIEEILPSQKKTELAQERYSSTAEVKKIYKYAKCCAPNCGKRERLIDLCASPIRRERYLQWEAFAGKSGGDPKKKFYLCKDHFDVRCFYSKDKSSRLVPGAYPSIPATKLPSSNEIEPEDLKACGISSSIAEYFSLFSENPSNIEENNCEGNKSNSVENTFLEEIGLSPSGSNASPQKKCEVSESRNNKIRQTENTKASLRKSGSRAITRKRRLELLDSMPHGVKTWKRGSHRFYLFPLKLKNNEAALEKNSEGSDKTVTINGTSNTISKLLPSPDKTIDYESDQEINETAVQEAESENKEESTSRLEDPPALQTLRKQFHEMRGTISQLENELKSWKRKYSTLKGEYIQSIIDQKKEASKDVQIFLSNVFSPGQIAKVLNPKFSIVWSDEELKKFAHLHEMSPQAYEYLQETLKYPLPRDPSILKSQKGLSRAINNEPLRNSLDDPAHCIDLLGDEAEELDEGIIEFVEIPASPLELSPIETVIRDHEYIKT